MPPGADWTPAPSRPGSSERRALYWLSPDMAITLHAVARWASLSVLGRTDVWYNVAMDARSHGMARGETRSGSQRRADVLVEVFAAELRRGDHRDVHG
jgi:hypothetical protein